MKNFKDFLHDTNDFILAFVIVVVAAGLITWRIHSILDYPEKAAREATKQKAQTEQTVESSASTIQCGAAFKNGVIAKDVTVTIEDGGSASNLADLVDKKLFDDYAQLTTAVESTDHKTSDIKGGTYTFNKGTSVEDVIATMTAQG